MLMYIPFLFSRVAMVDRKETDCIESRIPKMEESGRCGPVIVTNPLYRRRASLDSKLVLEDGKY